MGSKGEDNLGLEVEEIGGDVSSISKHENGKEKHDQDSNERQQWSNPIEFLLSCIAMSVSLI